MFFYENKEKFFCFVVERNRFLDDIYFNILRVVVCYKFYYFENGIRNENMYKSKVILSKIILGISKEKIMIF